MIVDYIFISVFKSQSLNSINRDVILILHDNEALYAKTILQNSNQYANKPYGFFTHRTEKPFLPFYLIHISDRAEIIT